jgi:glycosyltransferase involved in cell wall biosynthesis
MASEFIIHKNQIAEANGEIALSIVTPVYKNDPSALIEKIKSEINSSNWGVNLELVIVDDGSKMPQLLEKICALINDLAIPAKIIELVENQGRSGARNALIENSKGSYLLFLDSDMLPDCPNFIRKWLDFIDETAPTIAYGGFSTKFADNSSEYALARALAGHIDCLTAIERNERGPLAVATSNLLVRRDIIEEVPFDCGFKGWGWEDVDWALRANKANYAIVHFENSATHLGLDVPEVLLEKLKQAGPNFKHIASRHPQMLRLKSTKAARILAKIPFALKVTPLIQTIILKTNLPIRIKANLTRLWRACHAAISLSEK